MQKILIKVVDNGYYLESEFTGDKDSKEYLAVSNVFSAEDEKDFKTMDEDKIVFGKLVYILANKLGINYDKFGSENINITFDKKGHKI